MVLSFNVFLVVLLLLGSIMVCFYVLNNSKSKKAMVMIKCPDCGKKVSINADKCPRCYSEILKDKEKTKKLVEKNNAKKEILFKRLILWIYQIICGISILFVFEKIDNFLSQLIMLLALVLNTLSIIVYNVKVLKKSEKLRDKVSVVSILAVLCGLFFSINYTFVLINHSSVGYDEGVREIMYLETYTKEEAKVFLKNIYYALRENEYNFDNVELYGIWRDDSKPNEFYANFRVSGGDEYLPANSMKVVINSNDKTRVERIYWQFNDEVEIDFYKDSKQVEDFTYVYNCAIMGDEPTYPIKDYIEQEIKEKLKSPSSAIFTYNELRYSPSEKRFKIYGWVEGQNSFGAMVKEDFVITMKPCVDDYCEWYGVDYIWSFI